MYEENFKKTLFGYNVDEVKNYIETITVDHSRVAKINEDKIQSLQKRTFELELQITRLKEIETHHIEIQKKYDSLLELNEDKDNKIDMLSIQVDDLRERLNNTSQIEKIDPLIEETFKEEILFFRTELIKVLREREDLTEKCNAYESEKAAFEAKIEDLNAKLLDNQMDRSEMEESIFEHKEKIKALEIKEAALEHEKLMIAQALISAQEKAEMIEKESEQRFNKEHGRLEKYKKEIEAFRSKTVDVLQLFQEELDVLLTSNLIVPEAKSSNSQIQLIKKG